MTQSSTLAFLLTSQTFLTPLPTMATEPTSPPPPPNPNSKTIVITGCNSGIGFNAAYRMALSSTPTEPHTLILACRTLEKAQTAVRQIQTQMDAPNPYTTLIPKECDLADLSSIQSFVMDLKTSSSTISNPLDVVCYNAGLALNTAQTECVRTKDGFELTVGTNHLGHFYLNSLLLPMVRRCHEILSVVVINNIREFIFLIVMLVRWYVTHSPSIDLSMEDRSIPKQVVSS